MELQANRAEELAAKYQAGDRQAMEDLLQEIQNKVYYHCVKILRNENDAQDAAQEVLIAVLQGLDGLKNPSAFHSWLNRIVARTCVKTYDREHREITVGEDAETLFFEDLDDQQIPEKIVDTEETRRMIRELVDELPPPQRLCVLMYYYDEMPVKDIAEAMDAPENTVKSRLSYARKAIKAGVDRWIAQGLTLYSFTPLPYLRYFLQKESEDCHLPPVIALRIQEALLAAGTAGAAAAGGGALAGAGAAGAATAAKGAAVVSLLHRGAIALAGLLLAGGMGGLLLHNPTPPPEPPEPPQVVEAAPRPAEPEAPEFQPELLADTPEPAAEERTAPIPPPAEPPAEAPPVEPGGETPAPAPEETPEPEPVPEPEPEPRPDTERASERDSDAETDSNDDSDEITDPEPAPAPEPEPEPTPTPGPPDADSSVIDQYEPNYSFGSYLGRNEEGVHEFNVYLSANREKHLYPLKDGHYYVRTEVSDETRVGLISDYIYGIAPGTCEVRYYVSRNVEGPYALAVIAHVTVEPEEPVTPDYNWGTYVRTIGGIAYFNHTLVRGVMEDRIPLQPGAFHSKAVSSDPETVGVYESGALRALKAGTATVQYYTRWTENDPWVIAAVVRVTVLNEEPPPAEVAERQTLRVHYGSNMVFYDVWQGDLPKPLHFTSSDPSVVYVQPEAGGFSALAPGTAELMAYEPRKPGILYVLEVQVDDTFAWEYTMEDVVLSVGERQEQEVEFTFHTSNATHLGLVTFRSADWNIADIYRSLDDEEDDLLRFEVIGRSKGTTEVKIMVSFDVLTYDGYKHMETAFSFQVQVNDPPEDEIPTVRKELEQFGLRSGYGYTVSFSKLWGEELPEGLTYLSLNPGIACISEYGTVTTLSSGTVVLTATRTEEPACRYALTIHVEDRLECVRTIKEAEAYLEETNSNIESPNYELFASGRMTNIQWTGTDDPEILTVIIGSSYGCSVKALQPGKTTLHGIATFMIITSEGTKYLKDEFSIPVTVGYYITETEAVEAGQFGFCSGYGYTGSIKDYFPDLPEGLTFSSSDPNVAVIYHEGRFTTLKPGRVLLKAYTKFDPSGHQYAVWLDVQDAMDWTYFLEGAELDVGDSVLRGVTDVQLHSGVQLSSAYWYAADSRIVSVTKDTDDPLLCRVEAKKPGTTTVTGWLTMKAPYYFFGTATTSLSVTVSFPVTVREPGEPDAPVS